LYKTTNRGTSWTKLTNAATIDRVTSCTFNPNDPNQIYLTTETNGLWISSTINAATPSFSLVPSYPFQQPERVFFNPYNANEIWVTSFGNGMKMGTISTNTTMVFLSEENSNKKEFELFPNPALSEVTIRLTDDLIVNSSLEIKDISGRVIYLESFRGVTKVNISSYQKGTYLVTVMGEGIILGVQKMIVTD
jgi:hypothetical protein